MSKVLRTFCVLGSTAAVIGASAVGAQAKPLHINGKQTTITPSQQVIQFLTSHAVTVSAITPATLSNGSLTLPIAGGRAAKSGKRGVVFHAGGVEFSKGTRHLVLRHLVLAGNINHPRLLAIANGRPMLLARVTNATNSTAGGEVTINGDLALSARAAHKIDRRLGEDLVSAGTTIGTITSTITVGA